MIHEPFYFNLLRRSAFEVLYFYILYFTQQVGSENEIVQLFVGRSEDVVFRTFPLFGSLINIDNLFANTHYRVHVVSIDDGGHVVLPGNIVNQVVYYQRGFRVES